MAAGYTAKSIDKIRLEHQQIEDAFLKLRSRAFYRDGKLIAPAQASTTFINRVMGVLGYQRTGGQDGSNGGGA